MTTWPEGLAMAFGGDYNPEQWPEEVWREDVRLMREAGVTLVSVGIFSWATLEPSPGRYEFGWLDAVLDLLHEGGVRADLATATASPPPWFSRARPDSLPVTADGRRMWPGARQAYCPSSAIYREGAARMAGALAERYRDHPALAMWHVNNEYGCHVAHCYCDTSAAAFRAWLKRRYGDLDALNAAWGTAFWSQRYGDWEEIWPPRLAPTFANPTQQLDYRRFSSDELLACFEAEREVLRRITPGVPITTNFMAPRFAGADYWAWARRQDLVSNDHYLVAVDGDPALQIALAGDVTRGLAGGAPWLLMEHSTSAVNWQPVNLAKAPGQMRRNSLAHVARGSDGAMFFQWRGSRAGAEKFHSAMVPHAGTDTKLWREVVQLGADLGKLAEVRGSRVVADVAIVWDYQAWWAVELDSHPSNEVRYLERVGAFHESLWRAGITTDVVHPEGDLSGYRVVVVPSLYLVTDASAGNLAGWVQDGGHAVISYFSGIVDQNDAIRLGGYPGAYRELLGVRTEEFHPLLPGVRVALDDGSSASVWTEDLRLEGAEALAHYVDGPVPGRPAVTRRDAGAGSATYVATRPDDDVLARLLAGVCERAGVRPVVAGLPAGVEAVLRRGEAADFLFLLNHGAEPATVAARGIDLLTGAEHDDRVEVPGGGVAVLRQEALPA
jgi:beta-galactosidase